MARHCSQRLAAIGKVAKVNEAEAVKVTPDDETVINQFRGAIVAAASDPRQPICTSDRMGVTRCDGRRAIEVKP